LESLLALAATYPSRRLSPGEVLLVQGQPGGELYILETGQLAVERDGQRIATIAAPGSPIGEMAVVLGTPSSATVRAEQPTIVRLIPEAKQYVQTNAELAYRLAWLMANRLDATSAYLVELTRQHADTPQRGIFGAILAALHAPADEQDYAEVKRSDLFGDKT
jgi:CRP-like cAMP-binding protein